MGFAALDLSGLQAALKRAFILWAKGEPRYAPLFRRITPDTLQVAFDALDEMQVAKPGYFEVWWATNHNRYVRRPGVTQRQLSLLHEVFFAFLSRLARGELTPDDGAETDVEKVEGNADEERAPRRKTKGRR